MKAKALAISVFIAVVFGVFFASAVSQPSQAETSSERKPYGFTKIESNLGKASNQTAVIRQLYQDCNNDIKTYQVCESEYTAALNVVKQSLKEVNQARRYFVDSSIQANIIDNRFRDYSANQGKSLYDQIVRMENYLESQGD